MKSSILVLLALVLLAAVPALAATPAAASAAPTLSAADAEFLASLASPAPAGASFLAADPTAVPTVCHSQADCPTGYKCCYPCGIPDCDFVCMKVKRCPLIP